MLLLLLYACPIAFYFLCLILLFFRVFSFVLYLHFPSLVLLASMFALVQRKAGDAIIFCAPLLQNHRRDDFDSNTIGGIHCL